MKLFGIMPVYDEEDWIGYAIKNALSYVDHLVVFEGYHGPIWHFGSNRSHDGTRKILSTYQHNEKITLLKSPWFVKRAIGKGLVMRRALNEFKKRGIEPDDWIMLCDADEFYTPQQISIIKKELRTTKKDYMKIHNRMFIFNFSYYIKGLHGRLFRYTQGMTFEPYGQYPRYKDGTRYVNNSSGELLKHDPMYHYSWVRRNERELRRDTMNYKNKVVTKDIFSWYEQVYLAWNEKESEKFYALNQDLTKGKGWFYGDDSKILIYKGSHPKILDSHPFRHIKDVREL